MYFIKILIGNKQLYSTPYTRKQIIIYTETGCIELIHHNTILK